MELMNKPTRLRMILVRHSDRIRDNPDNLPSYELIDALEQDIKTFVKHIIHGAGELGLEVKCEGYIGDMD